jgi:hypothetical protein
MQTSEERKTPVNYNVKEALRVQRCTQKRKAWLEWLQQLEAFLQKTSLVSLEAFKRAEQVRLNTYVEEDEYSPVDSTIMEAYSVSSQADSLVGEMCRTYDVYLKCYWNEILGKCFFT